MAKRNDGIESVSKAMAAAAWREENGVAGVASKAANGVAQAIMASA